MSAEPNLNETDYELLSAYIDEVLTDEERSALETRLKNDPALRRELNALRQTVALVQALPTLKAPRNFTLTPEMVGLEPTSKAAVDVLPKPVLNRRVLPFPAISVMSAVASMALVVFGLAILLGGNADEAEAPTDPSTVGMTTNSIPQDDLSIAAAPTLTVTVTANIDAPEAMSAGAAPEAQTNMAEPDEAAADDMADMEMEEEAEESAADMAFDTDMTEATDDDSAANEAGDMPPQAPADEAMLTVPTTDDDDAAEALPEAEVDIDPTLITPNARTMPVPPSPMGTPDIDTFSLDMAEAEMNEDGVQRQSTDVAMADDNADATIEAQQRQSTDVAMADDDADAGDILNDEITADEPQESPDSGEIDELPSETTDANTLAGLLVIALGVVLGIFAVAFARRGQHTT